MTLYVNPLSHAPGARARRPTAGGMARPAAAAGPGANASRGSNSCRAQVLMGLPSDSGSRRAVAAGKMVIDKGNSKRRYSPYWCASSGSGCSSGRPRVSMKRVVTYENGRLETQLLPFILTQRLLNKPNGNVPDQKLLQLEGEKDKLSSNNFVDFNDVALKQEPIDSDSEGSIGFGGSDDDSNGPCLKGSFSTSEPYQLAPRPGFASDAVPIKKEPVYMEETTSIAREKSKMLDSTSVFIDTLLHALDCKSCPSKACTKMRLVLGHFLMCPKRTQDQTQCAVCNQLISIVTRHANEQCTARRDGVPCPVPMCDVITEEDQI